MRDRLPRSRSSHLGLQKKVELKKDDNELKRCYDNLYNKNFYKGNISFGSH